MNHLRVLVVEDRPADAELMAAELRRAGFAFDWHRVDSEREFLTRLEPLPDIILADFHMPQFGALRALQILKDRGLDIPFIIVSGSIGEETAVTALHEGATDYLLKDRLTRLGAAAVRALEAKQHRDKRRQAEEGLRESEQRYRGLFEGVPTGLYRSTPSGQLLDVNPAMIRMLGYPDQQSLLAVNTRDLYVDPSERDTWQEQHGVLSNYENRFRRSDSTVIWIRGTSAAVRDNEGRVQYYEGTLEDVTDRHRAEEQLAAERNLLRTLIDSLPDFISVKDRESRFIIANDAYARFAGRQRPEELLGKTAFDVFPPHLATQYVADDQKVMHSGQTHNLESETVDRQNQTRWHAVTKAPLRNGAGQIFGLVGIARDITDRKQDEEKIEKQLATLTALYAGAQKLTRSLQLDELAQDVVRVFVEVFGVRLAWMGQADPDGSVRVLAGFPSHDYAQFPQGISDRWDETPAGTGPAGRAIRSGFPVVDAALSDRTPPPWRQFFTSIGVTTIAALPLTIRDRPFGVVGILSDHAEFFTPERIEFFQAFANQAAAALENARLFAETGTRLQQLQALRNIDMAITASLDLRVTLNVILDQVTTHLKIDAANVLLFDPYSQTLRFEINRGFRGKALQHANLRLGEGHAGRAAMERRVISVPDLAADRSEFSRSVKLPEEGFVSYFAVPLIAKGQVKGVLEVLHRARLNPSQDWLNFLEALAGQAAIAIDNSTLFDNLQRVNTDLTMAYDTTLEGWSKALDLRDKETEFHTLRVTKLTVQLARTLHIGDHDLIHIRRGALLHDIGKMGIPDSILLKPGPLTDEEWVVMKKHPTYAYELLSPIHYLRLALDIPYCHHEKWDGGGYPRGLKGEEIPVASRVFAVIDVYDALTSDRPYRRAWPKEKALAHIREQAGKHFDPAVVAKFLEMDL